MEILHSIIEWIVQVVGQLGYPGIFIMMTLESSFFIFPSEVVMIPAGYLAFQGEMNLYAVIFLGIAGSLTGSLLNYYLAVWLGRPFLMKFGKYVFLTPEKIEQVEKYFIRHGEISTFIGRLITIVRQYISFPAGLAGMNIFRFILFTTLGAGLWVVILTLIGYVAADNQELITRYSKEASWGLLVFCVVLIGVYVWRQKRKKRAA